MKKLNKNLLIGIALIVLFFVLLIIKKDGDRVGNNDFRFAIVTGKSLKMVSISPQRMMVNVLKVGASVPVWLPYGQGWYRVEQIKNQKIDNTFFWYNFGFIPNKIIYSEDENVWENNSVLIRNLGLVNWLKYKFNDGRIFNKEEVIKDDLLVNSDILEEVMARDFADNRAVNDDLTLSVFNTTSEDGLANFLSKRLEWSGFSVVSSESTNKKIDKCLFIYGPKTNTSSAWKILNKIFDCKSEYSENLNENEAELYFGDNYVSMVKYSSYKRIF
ncbi:MAG: hypothetical protein WCG91_04495 [Candidatus Shapirobacteria bacterium]